MALANTVYEIINQPSSPTAEQNIQSTVFGQDFEAIVRAETLTGIISGCVASQRGAGANMSVDVSAGVAVANGTPGTLAAVNVPIPTADATNPRRDLIVITPFYGLAHAALIQGTPAAAPGTAFLPSMGNPSTGINATSGTAASATASTLTVSGTPWVALRWRGYVIRLTGGTGSGQVRLITGGTSSTIPVAPNWEVTPDATTTFTISLEEVAPVAVVDVAANETTIETSPDILSHRIVFDRPTEWMVPAPLGSGKRDDRLVQQQVAAYNDDIHRCRAGTYESGTSTTGFITLTSSGAGKGTTVRGWPGWQTTWKKQALTSAGGALPQDEVRVFLLGNNGVVEEMAFDGNRANQTFASTPSDFSVASAVNGLGNDITVRHCWFFNIPWCAISTSNSGVAAYRHLIESCLIEDVGEAYPAAGGTWGEGIHGTSWYDGTIRDCRIYRVAHRGIGIYQGSVNCESNLVDNCTVDYGSLVLTQAGLAIETANAPRTKVRNCNVVGPTTATIGSTDIFGISIAAGSDWSEVIGCSVKTNLINGLEGANSVGVRFIGNSVYGYNGAGLSISINDVSLVAMGMQIVSNHFENALQRQNVTAIEIATNATGSVAAGFIVSLNTFVDYGHRGVRLYQPNGTLRDCSIVGNTFIRRNFRIFQSDGTTLADENSSAIQIAGGSGHIIASNSVSPFPGGLATRGQHIKFLGGVGLERTLVYGNRVNGQKPLTSTNETDAAYDIQGPVDGCLFFGNSVQNTDIAFNAWDTPGVNPNYFLFNLDDGKPYNGLKVNDVLVKPDDAIQKMKSASRRRDEFASNGVTSGSIGDLNWHMLGGGTVAHQAVVQGKVGIIRLTTTTTNGNVTYLWLGNSADTTATTPTIHFNDYFDMTIYLSPVTTATTGIRIGLGNAIQTDPPTQWVGIEKDSAASTWVGKSKNSTSNTPTAAFTAIPVGGTWARLRVRRINGSTIGFTVNDEVEKQITTNLPTVNLTPFVQVRTAQASTAKSVDIDYAEIDVINLAR